MSLTAADHVAWNDRISSK